MPEGIVKGMSRDGRGTPGRIILKDHTPRLKLADLLRRRRTTLGAFVKELGFTTHAGLAIWCKRMGVTPPTHEEFVVAYPAAEKVNSPMEGVVVLEPPPVVDAESGQSIDPEAPVLTGVEVQVVTDTVAVEEAQELLAVTQKKTRKKKESQPTEA